MSPDRIEAQHLGGSVWMVSPIGEHDLATAPDLDTKLAEIEKTGTTIVIDFSAATFIDSSIIGVTVKHARHHGSQPGEALVVVAPPGTAPRRVLDLVHAEAYIELYEERDQALNHLGPRNTGRVRMAANRPGPTGGFATQPHRDSAAGSIPSQGMTQQPVEPPAGTPDV